jgi:outer membrane receptor protein involved in Fe transport
VKGVVLDSQTKNPIEFATISLFKVADSSLVTGIISDVDGVFLLDKIPSGTFYAKIAFIGFQTSTIESIEINDNQLLKDLGEIKIASNAKDMEEFVVVEEKDIMETKIDKRVYNVSKDVGMQGKMGLEVLKNMPSIDVDEQDNISLRGDQSVKVLIDGRPSSIQASQLLKQIPASSIEKIEVITNPSAKYNPEGMSGIINVVLKKDDSSGFNGSYNAGYQYNGNNGYNTSLNLNYKQGKFNVFGSMGLSNGTWGYSGVADRNYHLIDTTFSQKLTDVGANENTNLWYTLGTDYYVNKKNTIYFSVTGWLIGAGDRFDDNHYDFMDENMNLQTYSDRYSEKTTEYGGYNYNLGWQTQFKKEGHTLDIDFYYSPYIDDEYDKIQDNFYNSNDVLLGITQYQNTSRNSTSDNFNAKADYVLPINDSLKLELGVLSSFDFQDESFYSESNDTTVIIYSDVNLNNDFIYHQSINAFYATLGKQFKNIGIKVGSRLENTILDTELKNTNEKHSQNYFSFFPSAHLSYKVKEGNEYQLSYSKRINRPNRWELNPFTSYSDVYNFFTGNPALKPEYIDVYELSYIRYWDKFNFNSTVYYRQVNDKKNSITQLVGEGVSATMPENLAKSKINGGELIVGYRPTKWWKTNTSLNLWSSKVTDNQFNTVSSNTFGWMLQITSTQTIKKSWTLQVVGRYNGKSEQIQGYTLPRYGINVSLGKDVFKKKGKINISFSDIFKTRGWHFISYDLGNYSYESNRKWSSQSFNISFNYRFGKMNYDNQKRQKKNSSSQDNFSTGSGNSGQQ